MLSKKRTINTNILLVLIFTAALLYCYWPTLSGLVKVWYSSEDYSHGFFIIPVCAYIAWTKRKELFEIKPEPTAWGLIISILSLLVYVISKYAGIATLASVSIVSFVAGGILFLFGFETLKVLAFPVFFLLFMIPIPSQLYSALTIPLQLFVSKISVYGAQILQVTVYREGNVIYLPGYTMQVVQACSGLRSMISLLTLSFVFSYLAMRSNLLRSILFVSGIPIAIFVNVVRVLLTILVYYYFQYNLAEGSVHTFFGIGIFVFALVLLYGVKGVLSIWEKD
ncbi:MAG: exosortase/archaeosortase family protein [Syntrophaceae bacterium]|nr:exosortase/archaeosortase family protein [Syntrophaceae bacterium]